METPRILVVDDAVEMAEMVADGLSAEGFDAVALASSREAARLLSTESFDGLVTDLRMPEVDGMTLLAQALREDPERPVVIMTAYGAVDSAVEAIRAGAYHYVTKPFEVGELALFLRRALHSRSLQREARNLRQVLRSHQGHPGVRGTSRSMLELMDQVTRVAATTVPVLVLGETGTGKSLLAETLHLESPRAERPFVTVNCAALPEALLESELFGHVKGAFTGATTARAGLFEEADGGTLFLDEIGDMALPLQAKLLHVLERGVVRPVGGTKERRVDVRMVAATHQDLPTLVSEGRFREDLRYRLDVISLTLPPLRERREDIPTLIEFFMAQHRARHTTSPVRGLAPAVMERLLQHDWPGNVRELSHLLERGIVLGRGEQLELADLPVIGRSSTPAPAEFGGEVMPMRELQSRYATWAFEQTGSNRARTAEKLDIDVKTLARLLESGPARRS